MNLILFKSNELLLLSEEGEEDVNGFGEGGGIDQNDNYEEQQQQQQQQDKQKRSSKKNIIYHHHHHRHEQYKLLLSPNDKRTKHIVYHLKKESGQEVFVGCINGNKGKAIVQILLADDDEDNNNEFDNNTTDGYDEEEQQQHEVKAKNNTGNRNKRNNQKDKKSQNSMKKDRRQVLLLLQFHPTVKSSVATPTPTTTTTTTLTTSQQLPSQASSSPMYNITVIIAVPFPKVIKSLLSNVASMGISRIIIIRSELSNSDFCKTTCLWNKEEYESLIIEGMSQGCHTVFPQININVNSIITESSLNQLLIRKESEVGGGGGGEGEVVVDNDHDDDNDSKDSTDNKTAIKIFLDCGNEKYDPPPILNVLLDKLKNNNNGVDSSDDNNRKIRQKNPNVVVAIGPERGWTDDEMTIFENAGFISAMIGKSILKVETAAIASLGVICSVLDTYTISS